MKVAKANQADLAMLTQLHQTLESLFSRPAYFPTGVDPDIDAQADALEEDDDALPFSMRSPSDCTRAIELLREVWSRGNLGRAVMNLLVMLDPDNKLVDPDAGIVEHHPERVRADGRIAALEEVVRAALLREDVAHGELGDALRQVLAGEGSAPSKRIAGWVQAETGAFISYSEAVARYRSHTPGNGWEPVVLASMGKSENCAPSESEFVQYQQSKVEEAIEAAYWNFDARRAGIGHWKGCPQSERDAFKQELRRTVSACQMVPAFVPVARTKLHELLGQGWSVSGYAIQRGERHGLVTAGARVLWWHGGSDHIPKAHPELQPRTNAEIDGAEGGAA